MKTLAITLALVLACATSVLSEPRDCIDLKVIKDKVSITLGTKGTIQFKKQGDAITEPKLTKETDENTPGVGVEFNRHEQMLMLTVQNRFPKTLRYRTAMRFKGQKEYIETSIIPVMAGLLSSEMWGDPIEELILFEFKLTDEKF